MAPVVSENSIIRSTRHSAELSTVSTTFDPMRVHRPRGQLWAFVYLAVRHLLGMVVLLFRSERSNEIELLALRHEVAILRRQVGRPATSPPIVRCWPHSAASYLVHTGELSV